MGSCGREVTTEAMVQDSMQRKQSIGGRHPSLAEGTGVRRSLDLQLGGLGEEGREF